MVLRQLCDCPVTADYLSDAELLCPEEDEDFVIRARVFSVSDKVSNTDSSTLIVYLTNWIESEEASIVVNSVRVDGYSTCPVEIESFSDPLCEGSSSTKASTNAVGSSAGTGAIAGSIAGGLALIAVVIVALYIYRTWYKHKFQHKSRYGIIIIACISHL